MRQPSRSRTLRLSLVILLVALAAAALPQQVAMPNVSINFGGQKGADSVSTSLQILALLTVLSLAPAILILTTAFTRIVIIFGFLRQALGTQNIPPNQVMIGLSLFLTFFIMGPTYAEINEQALKPMMNGQMKMEDAVVRAQKPLKEFMLKNTYKKDLMLFANLRNEKPTTREEISILTVIPAFIVSELKTAFIIGFYIFIPFLIIDLIIASALMSMGMMMLPPVVVSLPAKVLVFVLADGWSLLVTAIMQGYR